MSAQSSDFEDELIEGFEDSDEQVDQAQPITDEAKVMA
jgi:hypothetical protein